MKWKDITSYSQGERRNGETPEPRSWEAKAGPFRIVVTRNRFAPGLWFMNWHGPRLDRQLESADVESAKAEALRYVAAHLREALLDLERE